MIIYSTCSHPCFHACSHSILMKALRLTIKANARLLEFKMCK
jgi:hypothetical protein